MSTANKQHCSIIRPFFGWTILFLVSICLPFRAYGDEARSKLKRAEKLYSSGKWTEAIDAFHEALKLNPDLPEAHYHLAKALEMTNQDEAAVAEYTEAVRLDPKNGWYHFDLGCELAGTGKGSQAAQEFQSATNLDPDDRETFNLIHEGLMEEVEFERRIGRRIPIIGVGGNIADPMPVHKPEPPYTVEARHEKYQGTVVVLATINAQGDVVAVRLKRPQPYGLDAQAINTIRTWKFKPATKDGVPIPIKVLIEVSFRLF